MRSQVTFRTAFTVCLAVLATCAAVLFVLRTRVAIALTVTATMNAIALDHVVRRIERTGIRRGWAILLTTGAVGLSMIGIILLVVPPAARQIQQLLSALPQMLDSVHHQAWFVSWNQRFGVEERLSVTLSRAFGFAESAVNPILVGVGSALRAVAALITLLSLTLFMLAFGGGLVPRLREVIPAVDRPRWESVLNESYSAIGGYLGGLLFICSVNATCTSMALALAGASYYLPLGLLSGFSSLVPYAGPVVTGGFITLVTLATGGGVKALMVLGYFLVYGQLEANVLAPLVFRRTVHLDPLVSVLAVLFLAELLGFAGAIVAVPLVAVAQIFVRELLASRRAVSAAPVLPPLFAPEPRSSQAAILVGQAAPR